MHSVCIQITVTWFGYYAKEKLISFLEKMPLTNIDPSPTICNNCFVHYICLVNRNMTWLLIIIYMMDIIILLTSLLCLHVMFCPDSNIAVITSPVFIVNSFTDAVNAVPHCPAGTMRKMDVSSVGRTTGPSLESCVTAALSPSPLGLSW